MRAIGFRCFKEQFVFVVLDGDQGRSEVVDKGTFALPNGLSWGEGLAWVRKQTMELLAKYAIEAAGMKRAEPSARRAYPKRSEIEGVIKEAVFSTLRRDCIARVKSQVRRDIVGFTDPARYVGRALVRRGMDAVNTTTYKEAALAALVELPSENDA